MENPEPGKETPAPIRFSDFLSLWLTLFFWIFWAALFALMSLRDLSSGQAATVWLSILSGPFAFFDLPGFPVGETLIMALICLVSLGIHLYTRHWFTALLACLGISFWFLMGLGLTFIGV